MTAFVIVLASGCAANDGDYCSIASPIWWDDAEQLQATPTPIVRQIATHNEVWAAVCGQFLRH